MPTLALLVVLMGTVIRFFNVGRSMNNEQVAETAKLILKEYYFLKIEDLKICFDGIKSGKYLPKKEGQSYGQLFDRLDGAIFLSALAEYSSERIDIAIRMNVEQQKQMQEEQQEEKYIIMLGKYFLVRKKGEGEEVELCEEERRDLATTFTWKDALAHKAWLIKNEFSDNPDYVRIGYGRETDIGKLGIEKPISPKKNKELEYKKMQLNYDAMKKEIMAGAGTDFEKHNKIRALSSLLPHTLKEYEQHLELLTKPKL